MRSLRAMVCHCLWVSACSTAERANPPALPEPPSVGANLSAAPTAVATAPETSAPAPPSAGAIVTPGAATAVTYQASIKTAMGVGGKRDPIRQRTLARVEFRVVDTTAEGGFTLEARSRIIDGGEPPSPATRQVAECDTRLEFDAKRQPLNVDALASAPGRCVVSRLLTDLALPEGLDSIAPGKSMSESDAQASMTVTVVERTPQVLRTRRVYKASQPEAFQKVEDTLELTTVPGAQYPDRLASRLVIRRSIPAALGLPGVAPGAEAALTVEIEIEATRIEAGAVGGSAPGRPVVEEDGLAWVTAYIGTAECAGGEASSWTETGAEARDVARGRRPWSTLSAPLVASLEKCRPLVTGLLDRGRRLTRETIRIADWPQPLFDDEKEDWPMVAATLEIRRLLNVQKHPAEALERCVDLVAFIEELDGVRPRLRLIEAPHIGAFSVCLASAGAAPVEALQLAYERLGALRYSRLSDAEAYTTAERHDVARNLRKALLSLIEARRRKQTGVVRVDLDSPLGFMAVPRDDPQIAATGGPRLSVCFQADATVGADSERRRCVPMPKEAGAE